MVDLQTRFVGIDLSSPILVASAGITEKVDLLRRAQEHGAAGAVMKSLFERETSRQSPSPRFRVIKHDLKRRPTFSLYSYEQASEWGPERYAEEVHRATEELDMLVIPSINCLTPEGWARYARAMEEAGARALELNTSCPHGSITFSGTEVEKTIYESVRAAREATTIPLIVKLSPMVTNPGNIAAELERIGVQAVTLFNRSTGLEVDVEAERPVMHGGYAGHGGPWAIQYPLRWISQLAPQLGIDIAGTSGITSGEDVVKYLLCGAAVVQICTAVVMNGYEAIGQIRRELTAWMERKGYRSPDEFRGRVCDRILGLEEVDRTTRWMARVARDVAPPCQVDCPIGTSIQGYVQAIASGKPELAYEIASARNPFPSICGRVCHHPCEAACTRVDIDDPLAIAALKRYAADRARELGIAPPTQPVRSTRPARVAVIGGGPAGLTAARELRRLGYPVELFEAAPALGGMMMLGIPRFRLPKGIIEEEIQAVIDLGVAVHTGARLGRDFTVESLRMQGFDAVLLAIGAHKPMPLGVPGEHYPHVLRGLDVLRGASLGQPIELAGHVVVFGGGDVAFDAARTAVRLGAESVTVAYRRSSDEMPASRQEREDAQEEGVRILYLCAPLEVSPGFVRCVRNRLGDVGTDGRRRPEPIEGSEFELAADWVIAAVGQEPDLAAQPELAALLERLRAPGAEAAHVDGMFAAGDALTGPQTLIDAIAGGHTAAARIHEYLSGERTEPLAIPAGRVDKASLHDEETILTRRQRPRMRPASERVRDFDEVSLGFSDAQAMAEAQRCIGCVECAACGQCARICIYGAIEVHNGEPTITTQCDGCGLCVELCPQGAIRMVERADTPGIAALVE